MSTGRKNRGYTTDLTFGWVLEDLGSEWTEWRQFLTEWMSKQIKSVSPKLEGIKHFMFYLKAKAPYCSCVTMLYTGHVNGHKVSSEEFNAYLVERGLNRSNSDYVNHIVDLCDYITLHCLNSDGDKDGSLYFKNPLNKIKYTGSKTETVHNPLPFRYILQLRQILCPYAPHETDNQTPWVGHHFKDWQWARDNFSQQKKCWMEVPSEIIDATDPDCVVRTRIAERNNKRVQIYEIWSPVIAMFLFVKLHLPLRSYQVRFLDSGEGDTWRYEKGGWVKNTQHKFKYGSPKRPYQKGVFRRIYDSVSENFSTGLYVSSNKTADLNKNEKDRGYVIPWQHEELLYWLEKLRNWQEKYNPIDRLTKATELSRSQLGHLKSEEQLKEMGEFAFLFRSNHSIFPMHRTQYGHPYYRLLEKLEENVLKTGYKLANGNRLRFVKDYGENFKPVNDKNATEFPLHSLRVSLITSYAMDTDLPLPVISRFMAGHSRLLMTIYYVKLTPSVMAEKMKEANAALLKNNEGSLSNFLADAEMSQIRLRSAYHSDKYNSVEAALKNRNPVGWEERPTGLCLVGGNTMNHIGESSVAGCWNGGPLMRDTKLSKARVYSPVPHRSENCVRCRWHITDATYLPALNASFNQLSYKATLAAETAVEIESQLETLKDELFMAEEKGEIFTKHSDLQALHRRYEKQRNEFNEYTKDYIATLNLINRIIEIENQRGSHEDSQKFIAVGSTDDLKVSMKFLNTKSELLHLSLVCEDAEFYPDLRDDLQKTPAITKRTNILNRMLSISGKQPLFLEMDEKSQLIAGNALMRKMAKIANPDDNLEGYRIAADYIEAQKYLVDSRLLNAGLSELPKGLPLHLIVEANK